MFVDVVLRNVFKAIFALVSLDFRNCNEVTESKLFSFSANDFATKNAFGVSYIFVATLFICQKIIYHLKNPVKRLTQSYNPVILCETSTVNCCEKLPFLSLE